MILLHRIFLWVFLSLPVSVEARWLDTSHEIFFTSEFKEKVSVQQEFPVFWWNFIVIEPPSGGPSWSALHRLCQELKKLPDLLRSAECDQGLKDFESIVRDWAGDLPLRRKMPRESEILKQMQSALAQASLPSGDSGLIPVLRMDPLSAWVELKKIAEQKIPIRMARTNGFFFDPLTRRVVIPFQTRFSPTPTAPMRKLRELIRNSCEQPPSCGAWTLIGSHPATLQNEEQVVRDLEKVTWIGALLLLAFGAALLWSGRWRFFLLLPPVLVAVGLSAGITVMIFGSIHGLTLSLGSAIIGLALDYGINGSLNTKTTGIWKTNLFGLLTTLTGLFALMMSAIPLLRQMMVFAVFGLLIAYLSYYLLLKNWPEVFQTEPFVSTPKSGRFRVILSGVLLIFSILGFAALRPDFGMAQFDFRDEASQKTTRWLFQNLELKPPLFRVHKEEDHLKSAHEEREWAEGRGIQIENAAQYLPAVENIKTNLDTWNGPGCQKLAQRLNQEEEKFFQPFLEKLPCNESLRYDREIPRRTYLDHLRSRNQWISLFFPVTEKQEAEIRSRYPDALSMREVVSAFPSILEAEIRWMAPLSLFCALALLFLYYRNRVHPWIAVLPFFTGMGLVTALVWLAGLPFSFISVMALVIVFGFSLDYGVFATDAYARHVKKPRGIWTAVTLSMCTTLSGFVPLLLSRHPLLRHLGLTLFLGALGTVIGAFWGIPGLMELLKNKPALKKIKKILQVTALMILLISTWALDAYHLSVFRKPKLDPQEKDTRTDVVRWIDKKDIGIHQLILKGRPFERGKGMGRMTRELLYEQEKALITALNGFFPVPWVRRSLEVLLFSWVRGIDRYYDPWMLEEMYGVSLFSSHVFNDLGDPFTRQAQYHAIHEVGQMMADRVQHDFGCTVIALPQKEKWVIGRNFDFEAGRIFDSEKVMKWVFPEAGHAFLSVIWTGMVGGVTAINDQGVYISINSAGSRDFRRIGTPSNLVLLKAIQFSSSAEEAVRILQEATLFFSDIFVVSDSHSGKLYRVEKSPRATEVIELNGPSVVTNHLISPRWKNDPVNTFRQFELTSTVRLERAEELLRKIPRNSGKSAAQSVLEILRDKGESDEKPLYLGNRRAIDALIATHSVIFDQPAGLVYVSRGPAVSGEFIGFDLKKSFEAQAPVITGALPRDPIVSDQLFDEVRFSRELAQDARRLIRKNNCADAEAKLARARVLYPDAYWNHFAWGDYLSVCESKREEARLTWSKALEMQPSYPSEITELKEKIRK